MRLWQVVLLVVLLAVIPVLSACETSKAEISRQEAYREAMRIYQEQMQAYNERTGAYQEELNKAYKEYEKELQNWYEAQQEELKQLTGE